MNSGQMKYTFLSHSYQTLLKMDTKLKMQNYCHVIGRHFKCSEDSNIIHALAFNLCKTLNEVSLSGRLLSDHYLAKGKHEEKV